MKRLLFLLAPVCLYAQTVVVDPILDPKTQPASLSVFANDGDSTYCVATPVKGTVPILQLTCRRAGVTYFTSTVIRQSMILTAGDLCWSFQFGIDATNAPNPQAVRFQVSENVRDPKGADILPVYGTVTQVEFAIGETVHDAAGTKSGTVVHWSRSMGTLLIDGVTSQTVGVNLILTNIVGPFIPGDQLVGGTSGASLTVIRTDPITGNKLKAGGFVVWPTTLTSMPMRVLKRLKHVVAQ